MRIDSSTHHASLHNSSPPRLISYTYIFIYLSEGPSTAIRPSSAPMIDDPVASSVTVEATFAEEDLNMGVSTFQR